MLGLAGHFDHSRTQGTQGRTMEAKRWPTELRLSKDKRSVRIAFDDGAAFELPAEYLRVMSPSAEVQGHSPSERKTVPGKRDVAILNIEPVGNYAVKLIFDDLHDTGIFGWDYLFELGRDHAERWQNYLGELDAKRLSREPRTGRRP
jgi:DUF971 family protein